MSTQTPVAAVKTMLTETPKPKSSIVSTVLRSLKTLVMGLVLLLVLWVAYSFGSKALLKYFKTEAPLDAPKTYDPSDVVSYVPQLGLVNEVNSDKTVDAILSGTLGPAVVLFHAEWCGHCKNMEFAYSAAAKASSVPFVKVNGPSAPVSSAKYGVAGYPTLFGVSSLGLLNKYTNPRTTEALLQFTKLLVPEKLEGPMVASMPSYPQYQQQVPQTSQVTQSQVVPQTSQSSLVLQPQVMTQMPQAQTQ